MKNLTYDIEGSVSFLNTFWAGNKETLTQIQIRMGQVNDDPRSSKRIGADIRLKRDDQHKLARLFELYTFSEFYGDPEFESSNTGLAGAFDIAAFYGYPEKYDDTLEKLINYIYLKESGCLSEPNNIIDQAIETAVLLNCGIVQSVSARYLSKTPVSFTTLWSAGLNGLYDGIIRFDYRRNTEMSTYLYYYVQGRIQNMLRMEINHNKNVCRSYDDRRPTNLQKYKIEDLLCQTEIELKELPPILILSLDSLSTKTKTAIYHLYGILLDEIDFDPEYYRSLASLNNTELTHLKRDVINCINQRLTPGTLLHTKVQRQIVVNSLLAKLEMHTGANAFIESLSKLERDILMFLLGFSKDGVRLTPTQIARANGKVRQTVSASKLTLIKKIAEFLDR